MIETYTPRPHGGETHPGQESLEDARRRIYLRRGMGRRFAQKDPKGEVNIFEHLIDDPLS